MMRPTCAYPPVLQPGLQNGTDMYSTDRDSFTFGIMGQHNSGCVPSLVSSPNGNLYQLSAVGSNPGSLNGSNGGNVAGSTILPSGHAHPGFSATASSTANTYSQIHMAQQPPYSIGTDLIPPGHHLSTSNPTGFSNQQSFPHMLGPSGDKMMPQQQNIPINRSASLNYSGPRASIPTGPIPSPVPQQPANSTPTQPYTGVMSGPNTGLSTQSQQPPPGRMSGTQIGSTRAGLQSEVPNSRSVASRPVSGFSDSTTGFQSPLYVSYSGPSVTQAGSGMQASPYSMGISNPGLSMSPMVHNGLNNTNIPIIGANYASGPNPSVGSVSSSASGRSTGPASGSISAGMQLSSNSFPPSQSTNRMVPTGYNISQSYSSNTSTPFRTQPSGALPRSTSGTASPTPQMHKDSSLSGCMGSQPPPPCSSAGPSNSGSPNPGANPSTNKSARGTSATNPNSGMFNPSMMPVGSCLTPPTAPGPGGMMMNGPQQSMVSSMNGCLSLGQDGEVKINPIQTPDGCYIQSRPMSSTGGRDSTLTSGIPLNGSVCSAGNGELMLSPSTFPLAPSQMNITSGGMQYAPTQQVAVIPNEFESMGPNSSPLVMMTIPASSPIPGPGGTTTLMNGPVSMNMAMNAAPAPPPYHHHQQPPPGSMLACRSSMNIGSQPGSTFFGSAAASSAMTCAGNATAPQVIHPMPDGMSAHVSQGSLDRHFIGMTSDGTMTPTGVGSSIPTSSTTTAPSVNLTSAGVSGSKTLATGSSTKSSRPKRTRNKNATGTGRTSKASAKKAAAQSASVTPSSASDPYALNHRLQTPGSAPVRQKAPNWNMNLCSGNAFPSSGIMSPTAGLPLGGCEMRTACGSPVSFSAVTGPNGLLMRPNSGPNVSVPNYASGSVGSLMTVPSPNDPNTRLSASPRQTPYNVQTVPVSQSQQSPQSQQHYFPPSGNGPNVSSSGFYISGPTSGIFATQQRTPPSAPPIGYGSTVPSGRPQPSVMHFQQNPVSQPPGSYTIGAPGRSGCGTSNANYPVPGPVQDGGPGRLASPGPTCVSVTSSTGDTDRLVCPITNGMVWGPTQIQMTDVMQQYLPDGVYVRRFEFDLTANHLQTIVGRTDLDIVVCSHLVTEPLQVCHWPSDAVQIRFNGYLLRLDRSSVNGGQSAHKVACVKHLCHPGRNQLEIAIVGLGDDPTQPATMAKRRAASGTLEMHRFAAFMAHMPALNVLLDGLQRRRPAGVSALCDILEGRTSGNPTGRVVGNLPVVAELSLICPVFRTRMRVPGRITGCEHIEAFDMEAFLRREVLWPRLNCPICGHKSPAGLDGLCIDTTILNALHLVHPSIESILVRSDGYWRLPPPICLDLPPDIDQWQPLIGPLTEVATQAFQSQLRGSILRGPVSSVHPSLPHQQHPYPDGNSSSDGLNKNQPGPQKNSVRTAWSNNTTSSSGVRTPSSAPCKDAIGSPQWSSSVQSTESPATQSFFAAVQTANGTIEKSVGYNADTVVNDSTATSKSVGTSRPASQPTTWGQTLSPSVDSRVSSTAAATPSTAMNSSYPSSSSLSATHDGRSHHQYPFSDPVSTSPLVGPRANAMHSDEQPGCQSQAMGRTCSLGTSCSQKVRRSSTGSSQASLVPNCTLSDGCVFDSSLSESLPMLSEQTESGLPSTQQTSFCDFTSSASVNVIHSPCLSAPSTQHPSSLPPSPALGPRPSSTSTVNFTIPAIPGVNMNAVDRAISTTRSPSVSPPVSTQASSFGMSSISKITTDVATVLGGVNSSCDLVSLSTSVSVSIRAEGSVSKPSTILCHTDSVSESSSDSTVVMGQQSSQKKVSSSLNMGLDFLLADDHGNAAGDLGNPTSSTMLNDPTFISQQGSSSTDLSESPSSNNHLGKRPLCGPESVDSEVKSFTSAPNSISKSDNQPLTSNAQLDPSLNEVHEQQQKIQEEKQAPDETSMKRMKLDPSLSSDSTDTKPLWNCVKPEPVSLEERTDELTTVSVLSKSVDSINGDESSNNNDNTLGANDTVNSTPTITISSSKTHLPPIPTEFDEDRVCSESLRTIFAQIDKLDVFLDESYVRFVESFSCI